MAINDEIIKVVEGFLEGISDEMKQNLRNRPRPVTYGGQDSKLAGKIDVSFAVKGTAVVFTLAMPQYGFTLDEGRGPTTKAGDGTVRKKIEDWIKRKGIVYNFSKPQVRDKIKEKEYRRKRAAKIKAGYVPKERKRAPGSKFEKALRQASFVVTRSIHRKGYKGNNFFSEALNKADTTTLSNELTKLLKKQVLIEITGK